MSTTTKPKIVQRCALCNRRITAWVYSKHTGARYCLPGKGCSK